MNNQKYQQQLKYLLALTEKEIEDLYDIYSDCERPKQLCKRSLKWLETPCKECPYNNYGCVCYNDTLKMIANLFGRANPYIIKYYKQYVSDNPSKKYLPPFDFLCF